MKQSTSNAPLDAVLEMSDRTLNTPCCGCCSRHRVAQQTPPNATTAGMRMEWRRMTHPSEPLHSSFEESPSSPRAAPAPRPSPASASAARWLPDRRLLGVRHTRSPAALTQTRTDRPAHDARLGGQPVTGVRVVLLLRTVSAVCRSPRSAAFPFSSRMKGHALKQSNAMVISPSCPPPQDAPPSASGAAAGTARQPSFSATESSDTPRRWGQGGVQQGEETGSASRAPSALTTAAGTERTSRPVQIHPWLEYY